MNEDCLFCKIAAGDVAADIVHRSDAIVGFRDINPQAPEHVLFIPTRHIATLNHADPADSALLGQLLLSASGFARTAGFADAGYRVAMNCNAAGGQTVYHVHLHLLGGRQLTWPPG